MFWFFVVTIVVGMINVILGIEEDSLVQTLTGGFCMFIGIWNLLL